RAVAMLETYLKTFPAPWEGRVRVTLASAYMSLTGVEVKQFITIAKRISAKKTGERQMLDSLGRRIDDYLSVNHSSDEVHELVKAVQTFYEAITSLLDFI